MNKRLYGILGYPLGHSFSPSWFASLFKELGLEQTHDYLKFEKREEEIAEVLAIEDLQGLNITIPYKQKMIGSLQYIEVSAQVVGAVNVLRRLSTCQWAGYNTDVIGFERSLQSFLNIPVSEILSTGQSGFDSLWGKVLVCGDGGASAAVQYVLSQWKLPFDVGVRHLPKKKRNSGGGQIFTYQQLLEGEGLAPYRLCVNTTPVGMFPQLQEVLPLAYNTVLPGMFFYDLVYNPEPTQMMRLFEAKGARVMGGWSMLESQAQAAWQIWQKAPLDRKGLLSIGDSNGQQEPCDRNRGEEPHQKGRA